MKIIGSQQRKITPRMMARDIVLLEAVKARCLDRGYTIASERIEERIEQLRQCLDQYLAKQR